MIDDDGAHFACVSGNWSATSAFDYKLRGRQRLWDVCENGFLLLHERLQFSAGDTKVVVFSAGVYQERPFWGLKIDQAH